MVRITVGDGSHIAGEFDILKTIHDAWASSGAWPEFIAAMRQSLSSGSAEPSESRNPFPFLSLPGLCCQAAGGERIQADGVAAAWGLLYTAAHVFDSVQDGDPADPWWETLGNGAAINVATGLLTSAWVVLSQLNAHTETVQSVTEDFQRTILNMASGQHLDITDPRPSLEQAWAVAEAKSGAFFALACRSGARIAGAEEAVALRYGEFGHNLGLMLQVGDDLADLHPALDPPDAPPLLVAYCLEISTPEEQERLLLLTRSRKHDQSVRLYLQRLIAGSGVTLYLATKLAQFRTRALKALEAAGATPPTRDMLAIFIRSLDPSMEAFPLQG